MNHDRHPAAAPTNQHSEELSLAKLHVMACVLMTKFHAQQCPQLAQFIVKHLNLLLEQPEINADPNSRMLYLQLLNQWQSITASLLEQRRQSSAQVEKTTIH